MRVLWQRWPLVLAGVLYFNIGLAIGEPHPFGPVVTRVFREAFLFTGVICLLVAIRPRVKILRVLSGVLLTSASASRALVFLFAFGFDSPGFAVWLWLAIVQAFVWPHILPPRIEPADIARYFDSLDPQDLVDNDIYEPSRNDILGELHRKGEGRDGP